jgi:hypothetical protein
MEKREKKGLLDVFYDRPITFCIVAGLVIDGVVKIASLIFSDN